MGNNPNDISPELLSEAQKKIGMSPEEIKKAVQSGNVSGILKNLGKNESQKIKEALSNREAAMKLLSTPKAQAIIKKFFGGK